MELSEPGAAATARTARFDWRAATRGANLSFVRSAFGRPMACCMTGGTIFKGSRMAFCASAGSAPAIPMAIAIAKPLDSVARQSQKGDNLAAGLNI